MSDSTLTRHGRLILVPAIITLAVTLLRLVGELQQWSSSLFNREAGGGMAIVGIVWLVPIFGIYFALRLAREGAGPGKLLRAFGLVLLALVLLPIAGAVAGAAGADPTGMPMLVVFAVASVVAVVVAVKAWPELGRVLVAYGLAARIPVAIVMLIAIFANWGTHYDVPPTPDFPEMAPLVKWFWIGFLPQMTVWIAFTVVVGMLFGLIAVAIAHRGRAHQSA
jgi:hypothetical protein